MLERSFPLLWISGEVSNFTRAASGHWYFSIKDQQAQMRCVMFRGRAQYAEFTPREGDRIEVRAVVTMYEPRGEVQLNVEAVRRTGQGRLYEAFLRLKAQLESEGLFAPERKRPLPAHPRAIGIVTSLQAAALRDVLTTLARRAPHIPVIVYPAPVQGAGSAEKLVAAVETANARREVDVLLVCRGGGSIEDLWSFNDEALARAIAASELPVVSGVGHETDFTIADFAADVRAPTPTGAAELASPQRALLLREVGERQRSRAAWNAGSNSARSSSTGSRAGWWPRPSGCSGSARMSSSSRCGWRRRRRGRYATRARGSRSRSCAGSAHGLIRRRRARRSRGCRSVLRWPCSAVTNATRLACQPVRHGSRCWPAAHARARLCGADRCADGPRGAHAERAEAAAPPDRASRGRLGRRVDRRRAAAADRYDLT